MNRIVVFLISGAICFYQFDSGETALLEKIQHLNTLKDCEGKAATTSQTIRCMTVIRADSKEEWIPPLDSEIFNDQMHLNALSDILTLDLKVDLLKKMSGAKKHAAEMQEYLVFGMSKGSVYIVNTQKIDRIYARVTVTRAAVSAVAYIEKSRLFASTCEECKLSIWSLDAGRDGN